jgi:hypothetical protein
MGAKKTKLNKLSRQPSGWNKTQIGGKPDQETNKMKLYFKNKISVTEQAYQAGDDSKNYASCTLTEYRLMACEYFNDYSMTDAKAEYSKKWVRSLPFAD